MVRVHVNGEIEEILLTSSESLAWHDRNARWIAFSHVIGEDAESRAVMLKRVQEQDHWLRDFVDLHFGLQKWLAREERHRP